MTFVGGWYTDFIRKKGWCRTITIRKINTILGLLVPAVTVVLAGYSGCNATLAILLFTISVGFSAFTIPGCKASMMEFAPQYAGIIYGKILSSEIHLEMYSVILFQQYQILFRICPDF